MSKKITHIFVITFFITAFFVLMYSFGYRIYIVKEPKIIPTGSIFVKQFPAPASVILNNEQKGTTSQFTGEFLIQSLPEGVYHLQVTKDGYQVWEKKVKVQPQKVAEFKFIDLFKNNYTPSLFFSFLKEDKNKTTSNQSSNQENAIHQQPQKETLQTQQNQLQEQEQFQSQPKNNNIKKIIQLAEDKFLIEAEDEIYIFNKNKIFSIDIKIIKNNLSDFEASEETAQIFKDFLMLSGTSNTKQKAPSFLFFNLPEKQFEIINLENYNAKIDTFKIGNKKIIFLSEKKLYLVEFQEKGSKIIISRKINQIGDNVLSFDVIGDELFFIEKSLLGNKVFVQGWFDNEKFKISKKVPLYFHNIEENKFKVLKENGLIIFKLNNKAFVLEDFKVFLAHNNIIDFSLSPDKQKIAIPSSNELILFFIKKRENQPQKEKFEKVYLWNTPNKLLKSQWLDGNNLLILTEKGLYVIEADDRDYVNSFRILESEIKNFFYNFEDNMLYIFKDDGVYSIENLREDNLIF